MIRFAFSIKNIWAKDLPHKDYFYFHKQITKTKSFETQIYRSGSYNIFKLSLDTSWRGDDHAGPSLEIELGKYYINLEIYDHRHWDYEKGTWEAYDPNNMETDNDDH
jgi:hypothetical protein